jgi:hypothetical protein
VVGNQKKNVKRNGHGREWKLLLYAELATLGVAGGCCALFALKRPYAAVLAIGAIAAAPFLKRAVLAEKQEYRRFCDANSYIQQFISGMILHKRIPAALEEVYITFPDGQMHETIRQMLLMLRRTPDIEKAEKRAFDYMLSLYPNSQLPLIHEFAMRVEKRGGEFEAEMKLLSEKREKWEKRTEHCQNAMRITLYSAVLLYVTMILVCAFVQRMMPSDLSVLATRLSQASEVIFILLFYLFVYRVISNLAGGWMKKEVCMGEEKAKRHLAYLEKWNPENWKGADYLKKFMFLHRLYYWILLQKVKKEISFAFPRWLFDVCLLMQKYNITVSVTESLKTAPPILKEEIRKLLEQLKRNPSGVDAYLSFLEQYRIPNVKTTMRMLVAIQNGTAGDMHAQMEHLIAHNMNMIDEMDAKETELRDAWNVRYNIYPMIPGAIVMGGYLVSMIVQVFRAMSALI